MRWERKSGEEVIFGVIGIACLIRTCRVRQLKAVLFLMLRCWNPIAGISVCLEFLHLNFACTLQEFVYAMRADLFAIGLFGGNRYYLFATALRINSIKKTKMCTVWSLCRYQCHWVIRLFHSNITRSNFYSNNINKYIYSYCRVWCVVFLCSTRIITKVRCQKKWYWARQLFVAEDIDLRLLESEIFSLQQECCTTDRIEMTS